MTRSGGAAEPSRAPGGWRGSVLPLFLMAALAPGCALPPEVIWRPIADDPPPLREGASADPHGPPELAAGGPAAAVHPAGADDEPADRAAEAKDEPAKPERSAEMPT